jgi:multiple sugar transport system permease protein
VQAALPFSRREGEMFPTPIQKRSRAAQITYQTLLPLALILWLAAADRGDGVLDPPADFTTGNYWGVPSSFEFSPITAACSSTDMPRYLLNSVLITVPTVDRRGGAVGMTGFALGIYRFKGNL